MSTILSECAGILLEFLGSPPREIFDEQAATMACMEAQTFYQHQAGPAMGRLLTGRNFELDPQTKEFQINQDGFTSAVYVERRAYEATAVGVDTDVWEKVEIVDIPDLDNEGEIAEYSCAFYGQPPTMRLSWDPALDSWSHLKIWHSPDSDEAGTLDDDLSLPIKLLKYMIPRRGVLLSLDKLQERAPSLFTDGRVDRIEKRNMAILRQYEQEWEMWRFQSGEDEGWSQMEGTMDRFYGHRQRTPFSR